jgi:hypothetical protein
MSLPPVPSIVQAAADASDLGELEWIQPDVVRAGRTSEQGYYFFRHGMVQVRGHWKLKPTVYLWRDVTGLDWSMYVTVSNNQSVFQRVRVWTIRFKGGETRTIELPEAPQSHPFQGVTDAGRAEGRVWRHIVREWRGDVAQNLEDKQEPITMGGRFVAKYEGVTLDGNDYKWANIDSVWPLVTDESWGRKPKQQSTQVVIRTKLPPRPRLPKIKSLGPDSAAGSSRFRDYQFDHDELDLPLLLTLVAEMPLYRKGFNDEQQAEATA